MGMLPAMLHISDMVDSFAGGGSFKNDLSRLLDLTEGIDRGVKTLTGTLGLFSGTLGLPANVRPKSNAQVALDHECLFCEQVSSKVSPVKGELNNSLGQA